MSHQFSVADVFTTQLFNGAQVAVFPTAEGLSLDTRTRIAAELNHWATVFVERQTKSQFQVSTFTPHGESAFGSHTAVAAATVLVDEDMLQLNETHEFCWRDGHIDVHVEKDADDFVKTRLAQKVPRNVDVFVPERKELADLLGLSGSDLDAQPYRPLFTNIDHNYLIVPVTSYKAVRQASFDMRAWRTSSALSMATFEILVFCRGSEASKADFHARLFGPYIGATEDPPIGAAVPAFVSYTCAHDHIRKGTQTFNIERGIPGERISTIEVEMDNNDQDEIGVRIGGTAVISVKGEVKL